ncbi:hypothetical protein ACI65C_011247 [Semiaphis heraclei]
MLDDHSNFKTMIQSPIIEWNKEATEAIERGTNSLMDSFRMTDDAIQKSTASVKSDIEDDKKTKKTTSFCCCWALSTAVFAQFVVSLMTPDAAWPSVPTARSRLSIALLILRSPPKLTRSLPLIVSRMSFTVDCSLCMVYWSRPSPSWPRPQCDP